MCGIDDWTGIIIFGVWNNVAKVKFISGFEITILFSTATPRLAGFSVKQQVASAFSLTPVPFVKLEKFGFS